MTRKYKDMSKEVDQLNGFLIGSKLGDGAFIRKTPNHNTYIVFKHAENQYDYLLWKFKYLETLTIGKSVKERDFKGKGLPTWQRQFYFPTISIKELNYFHGTATNILIDGIDEMGMAVWFLDDGNHYKGTWKVATGSLPIEDQNLMINTLKIKFNINSYLYESKEKITKNYIRIDTKDSYKVKDLILSNVPNDMDIIKNKFTKE